MTAETLRMYRKGGEWHTARTKPGRARTIPFPPAVAAVLRQQRTAQLEDRLRAGSAWRDSGLVFTNMTGGPLSGFLCHTHDAAAVCGTGLEPKRFHDLRHTAATLMLVMGVPLETIHETLGHASFGTMKDIYAHVLPSMQREATDRWANSCVVRHPSEARGYRHGCIDGFRPAGRHRRGAELNRESTDGPV